MIRAATLAAVLLLLAAGPADAEKLYVVDRLVIGVTAAPEAGSERVGELKSGESTELLERQGELAHVRLVSGKEGWVRAAFLTADTPPRERLAQRERELGELRGELELLKTRSAAAASEAGRAAASAVVRGPPLLQAEPAAGTRLPWLEVAGIALAALGAGFLLGWRVLDRRIRRRYGGLRIY